MLLGALIIVARSEPRAAAKASCNDRSVFYGSFLECREYVPLSRVPEGFHDPAVDQAARSALFVAIIFRANQKIVFLAASIRGP